MRPYSCIPVNKKILHLRKIMDVEYRESIARVVAWDLAWDDTALEMQQQNVHPLNGLFWGEPQVVQLKWKCTALPPVATSTITRQSTG